ncbi:hypothetical protein BDV96DRAFT_635007 [Lophiotrema nucula]|uniref:Zn(2)-C6 fungal-type domain-containing protein n=1 Tax=Lophiotrema nucula TaxID=690887 RepID=A0A6A5YYT8_9PLEO|nr:hypothetical protein BDV96DRAFT_635007 [Lophiotrema nucula]
MGFPSTACQQCRQRRVKCDEAQPVCARCAKAGRICSGAKSAFADIHIENNYASGQKKRPRGPRTAPNRKEDADSALVFVKRMPRSSIGLHDEALLYYMRYHLQGLDEVPTLPLLHSVREDVLGMWTQKASNSVLDLAISSLALAVFARTKGSVAAGVEASYKYSQLLKVVGVMIPHLNEQNIETCLLAILMMGLYEDSVYKLDLSSTTPFLKTLLNLKHSEGLVAVLKHWKEKYSAKSPPTQIIKHARRVAMKLSLVRNSAMPEWLEDGRAFGEKGIELEYDWIMARMARLRQNARVLTEASEVEHVEEVVTEKEREQISLDLDREAKSIDAALQGWRTRFPKSWVYEKHTLPSEHQWPKEHFYGNTVHSFRGMVDAAVWTRYYSSRMLVNSTRLSILRLQFSPQPSSFTLINPNEQVACLLRARSLADEIAAAIPFCLKRFEFADGTKSSITPSRSTEDVKPYLASLTIFPLSIASSNHHIDTRMKAWFQRQMVHMNASDTYALRSYPLYMFDRVDESSDAFLSSIVHALFGTRSPVGVSMRTCPSALQKSTSEGSRCSGISPPGLRRSDSINLVRFFSASTEPNYSDVSLHGCLFVIRSSDRDRSRASKHSGKARQSVQMNNKLEEVEEHPRQSGIDSDIDRHERDRRFSWDAHMTAPIGGIDDDRRECQECINVMFRRLNAFLRSLLKRDPMLQVSARTVDVTNWVPPL